MAVETASARYTTTRDDATYYFCSAGCLQTFETEPAR
jgi:YHS domain-containing protein